MEQRGIPGLKGAEHFGFTVPNLEEAVKFFTEVIGAEVVYTIGPFSSEDDWMTKHLNVHKNTVIPQAAVVKCGNGSNFEIFEFIAPDQKQEMPKNSDWGGRHIAFYVTDIHSAVNYLKQQGLQVLGDVTTMSEGPSAKESWVYFLTPWGMQLELVSYEQGKQYEQQTELRAFRP